MFAKNSKAYSVYLLIRFVFSLAVSMSTVLSIVCHLLFSNTPYPKGAAIASPKAESYQKVKAIPHK